VITARSLPRLGRVLLTLAVVALAPVLNGCEEEQVSCPAIFISSFRLQIVDAAGALVPDLTVTYRLDGGPVVALPCFGLNADKTCSEWTANTDRAGTFVIEAHNPDRTLVGSTTATIASYGSSCGGPISQSLRMTLGPP
jgi:hypothetical protein